MAKRIYKNTVLRWAEKNKYVVGGTATVGTLIGLYFLYLSFIGAIIITGYSGDTICAGTLDDPCYAFVNFTAQEDIFIYPLDYDPYNRDIGVSFDPNVKDWKMERSWGSGWREIDLNDTCKGTWCGGKFGAKTNVYSFAFREKRDYQIRITAYKEDPRQDIKWAFGPVDPTFLGINKENIFPKLISNKADIVGGEAIFEIVNPLNKNVDLNNLKFDFYKAEGENIRSFEYYVLVNETYQTPIYSTITKVMNCTRRINNITSINETYDCSTQSDYISGYETKQREIWNQSEIIGRGTHKIKIVGRWKAHLGEQAIDWQPTIIFPKSFFGTNEDISLTRSQWAWWNVSFDKKRELSNFDIDGKIITINITYDSDMVPGGEDLRFTDSSETQELGYMIRDKSEGVWFYVDIRKLGNESVYMYYDNISIVTPKSSSTDVYGSDLIAYYTLDGTSGAVEDETGNNDGTNQGADRGITGQIGNAFNFTLANSDYFTIPDITSSFTTDASLVMWVKIGIDPQPTTTGFITLDNKTFMSHYRHGDSNSYLGAFRDDRQTISPANGADATNWLMITITQTPGANGWKYYVNDTIFFQATGESIVNIKLAESFQFGRSNDGGVSWKYFNGSFDEIEIHNGVIDATEIAIHYNHTEPSYDLGAEQSSDEIAPTITLLAPDDNSLITTPTIFAANVFDNIAVDTVILYGNFSGSWAINSTNSSGINNTDYNFTLSLADGAYLWAYWANDTSGNGTFSANRTVNIDSTVPLIAFDAETEANGTVKGQNYVYANVTVTELNEDTIVFAIFNDSGVVNSTQFTLGSIRVINWTGLIDGTYEYNVTVNDTAGNSNSTETRLIYLTTFSLFLNDVESNLDAELNSSIPLIANSTVSGLTICIDIDHPDYGINYTCETGSSDYNVIIDYFRNTTFSDLTTDKDFYFVNKSVYNLTLVSHQYDEVESLKFNISGTTNPTETIFFRANTTPDITNLTQFEPLIDRYYDGKLVGSDIYDFELSDGSSSFNITFQNAGEQFVYLLIDDVLQNRLDYTFFLNVTGFLFGFSVDYGNHPNIEGSSIGDGIGFLDYDFVDTALTTAQIDRSGAIMTGNVSSINHVFDDFEDGALDQSLWLNGTCTLEATYRACSDETGGNLRIRTWANVGGTATMPANVFTQVSPLLPFTAFETEVFNFSIVVDYDGTDSASDATLSTGWAWITFFANQVWNMTILDVPSGTTASETADAEIDFMFEKINRTHWRMTMWGTENSTAQNNPSSPSEIVYNGDQTIIPIDNWDEGIEFFVKSFAKDGETTNTFYVSEVNRTAWNRANSTLISKSVFDSSGFIDAASMEITVINNSAFNKGDENITLYMSADDGDNWEFVTWTDGNESEFGVSNFVFANQGEHLKFRIDFNNTNWDYNTTMLIPHLNVSVIEGNVSNLVFDFGDDGTADFTFSDELNVTNSPQEINLSFVNISSAFTSTNRFINNSVTYPYLYKIPLSIASDSRGILQIDAINLTYNPNPVSLNITPILNTLSSSVNFTLFRIPIAASNSSVGTNASINFGDIRYDYKGGKDNVTVLLHDPSYTLNVTWTITNYYSDFYKNLPYTWATDIFFLPRTNSSKNVSAHGQTTTIPIFNITATNYGGVNLNFSLKVNETFSCMDITWNATGSGKPAGQIINTSLQEVASDIGYLSNTQIWLWADLDNCNASQSRILTPSIFIDSCCIGCEVCL